MNRKFLVMAITFMAVAMLATPVMAVPTKGLKVLATVTGIPLGSEDPEYWRTNGDIGQARGGEENYLLILNIGGAITTEVVTTVFDEVINFKTDMFVRRYTILDSGLDDGFAGNIEMKMYNYYAGVDVHYDIHCVLQGFGDFEGQTLMLSYEGPIPLVWTGYCLKG